MRTVTNLSHRFSFRAAAACAALLLSGCATTSQPDAPLPPAAPRVPATRFVAAPAVEPAGRAEWIGSYEGTADIYLANEDQWQRDVPIELFVQGDGSHVRVMGQMALAASRSSFYVGQVETYDDAMLVGEYADGDRRYAYSLVREAEQLKGFVKMHQLRDESDALLPGYEWHFDVQRRALTDPR